MPQKPTASARLAMRDYPANLSSVMYQKWRDLLFLHWEYDSQEIQKTLPPGLFVDEFNGKAYAAITPFFMKDVRPKMMPALPGVSDFLEMNVRTYVYDENGTPGVWFYSLDANSQLAVQMARSYYYLPYFYAQMEALVNPNREISYHCQRNQKPISMDFLYQPIGEQWEAEPQSLEFFLVERYALFSHKGGTDPLSIGRIHHRPYPLLKADVRQWSDKAFELDGLKSPERAPDHILFSTGVDVEVFPLQTLSESKLKN